MKLSWVFLDAGNTLIGLDYSLLVAALSREGFTIDEMALRHAERAARVRLDRIVLDRWARGALPRTGWIEDHVWRGFWRDVLETAGAPHDRSAALAERVLSITRPASSWTRVEEGTAPALEALTLRGLRLGVISNSSGTLEPHLKRLGLARHFEVILDSHHEGVEKPHPEIFLRALERAGGVSPDEALYVGDVYAIDVLGAAGAGMHALLFDPLDVWDHGQAPPGAPPCRTIAALTDLPSIVDAAARR